MKDIFYSKLYNLHYLHVDFASLKPGPIRFEKTSNRFCLCEALRKNMKDHITYSSSLFVDVT
jgi:hypothetical protein